VLGPRPGRTRRGDAIVDHFEDGWGIERSSVFSMGHSRGARFTEVLACYRGETHTALAMMSAGSDNVAACPENAPVWFSHSTDDTTVAYLEGETHLFEWAERNGCDEPDPKAFPLDACTALTGCEQPVTWCPTTGGEWSGHAPPALADEEVWTFFSSFL
jgi:poly(3-hydroxybutyrate) depolymerase